MESDKKVSACDYELANIYGATGVEEAWYREIERRASERDAGVAETVRWESRASAAT